MQLIQGSSLSGMQQVMTRDEKVRAVQQVAEALHAAHSQGLIHRDIKPGNILVERRPDGTFFPFLMDFGLVKEVNASTQTSTGGIEGTPAFMAPEQARGESRTLDARADIYGLGATLYGVLAGRPPFLGSSADVLLAVLLSDAPRLRSFDPAIAPALETIVHKCLEKEPTQRYATAQELAADLGRFLDGERIAARPPGLLRRLGRFIQRRKLLAAVSATVLLAALVLGGVALRLRIQAATQARLAQQLGQQITQMEWVLRSARQLPLHNLDREKSIVRARLQALRAELSSYGAASRGLAHDAIGRGHLALREYPEALVELQQAQAQGVHSPDLHYALGIVLGKHFEQAMYEARLAGGGDWAQKKLKEFEPKYLQPALDALARGRSVKLDAPQYLEGLIAFYRRDYAEALRQADAAIAQAPWLYEARKLQGDVHLEQALQTRDHGKYEEAEKHFAAAVSRYTEASQIGNSDPEVYEGLAESWVRQVEMAAMRGKSVENAYVLAINVSEKILTAVPNSLAGNLKKAFSILIFPMGEDATKNSQRLREGIRAAEAAHLMDPRNPYATEVLAGLLMTMSNINLQNTSVSESGLRRAIELLEPVVRDNPQFLWGINDLGLIYQSLAELEQRIGRYSAKDNLVNAMEKYADAEALDPGYQNAVLNAISAGIHMVSEAVNRAELIAISDDAESLIVKCLSVNKEQAMCSALYGQIMARLAYRSFYAGLDAEAWLKRALDNLQNVRARLPWQRIEQHAALAHVVEAGVRLRQGRAAGPSLAAAREDLARCFKIAAEDATCRALAAQVEWAMADSLAAEGKPRLPALSEALARARLATTSRERLPESWWTLGESHLRLARAHAATPRLRDAHIRDGLAALDGAFAINPSHAPSRATQGALYLLRAQATTDRAAQAKDAQQAVRAVEQALARDPLLSASQASLLSQARSLAAAP